MWSHDKLKTLYLHYRNFYGYQTWQDNDGRRTSLNRSHDFQPCGSMANEKLYIYFYNINGSQTVHGDDIEWGYHADQVTWNLDHVVTGQFKSITTVLYFVFYLPWVILSISFFVLKRYNKKSHSIDTKALFMKFFWNIYCHSLRVAELAECSVVHQLDDKIILILA